MIREAEDQTFLGKALMRKGKTSDGEPCVIITGVFMVDNIDDFDDGDEMWVCRLVLDEAIKKHNMYGSHASANKGPEDFLVNRDQMQNPEAWRDKPNYKRRGKG